MDKTIKAITAIIIAIACVAALMVTTEAEERYIEKQFVFGRYAPVVAIHHPVYNWVLELRPDGSLSWAKPAAGKASQTFVILPTSYTGCYAIREFNNGSHTQRYLTYTQSGFRMEAPGTDKYGMEIVRDTQAYKLIWKASDKCGGKSFKNVWRLSCRKNGICASVGGWGSFRLGQTNWSEDY